MAKEIVADSFDADYAMTLRTPSEIVAYFANIGVDVRNDEADGIVSLDVVGKETLIGRPFLMVEWRVNTTGKFGTFVSVVAMDDTGKVFVFNDGSTGIAAQLAELSMYREAHGHPTPYAGRYVKNGLRVSQYEYTDEATGKTSQAETYYLNW